MLKNPKDEHEMIKMKDIFEAVITSKVPSAQISPYIKENFGDALTHGELICIAQLLKAQNERDTAAAAFIRDTLGQKPTDKQEISGSKDNPFYIQLDPKLQEWSK